MATTILFADTDTEWPNWKPHLELALAQRGVAYRITRDTTDPEVEFVVYSPKSGLSEFSAFPKLRAVLSTWAGVERIVGNPAIRVPLTRMVDPGLTEGMVEYCLGHILRHHLGLDAHSGRRDAVWQPDLMPPLARERVVAVLGLGALGMAVAKAARGLNFDVQGWARTPRSLDGLPCHHGEDGLKDLLGRAHIVVLLLPLTGETRDLLDARRLGWFKRGASLINPGRGPLIVDEALIAALDDGRVAHATLDVFRTEPLPETHAFWHHPRITVTPHIAADTRPSTAAHVIAENVRRALAGEPLLHLVDRSAGY